jgi:uncharacterized membrane protein YtjA (UPF0391 family)
MQPVDRHAGCSIAVDRQTEESPMLYWALMFLLVALIAGVFGFSGISEAATGIARILFFVFLVFFIVSLVAGSGLRAPPG